MIIMKKKSCVKDYSDPSFFFESWAVSELAKQEKRNKERKKKKNNKKLLKWKFQHVFQIMKKELN